MFVVLLRRAVRRVSALDDYLSALVLSSFLSFDFVVLYNILVPDPCFARAGNPVDRYKIACRCAVCVIDPARC